MPQFVVKQPNGLLAVFSTIVDNFTVLDMTVAEAVDYYRPDMCEAAAVAKVNRGVIDEDPERPGSGPGSGHDRWDQCIRTIECVHTICELSRLFVEHPSVFADPVPAQNDTPAAQKDAPT